MGAGYKSLTMETDVLAFYLVPKISFSPFLESHKVHQAMQGIRGRCVPGSRERGWEMVKLKDHQQQEMEQRASWNFTQA